MAPGPCLAQQPVETLAQDAGFPFGHGKSLERELAPGPCLVAEKVGFEPTVPVKGLPDFESGPL